jgi:hypothetical protein
VKNILTIKNKDKNKTIGTTNPTNQNLRPTVLLEEYITSPMQ